MPSSIPSLSELSRIFFDTEACEDYLIFHGVYWTERSCPECGASMNLAAKTLTFRCGVHSCRKSLSMKANSFFFGQRMPVSQIMLLGYLWLNNAEVVSMATMAGCSRDAAVAYCKLFRQLVAEAVDVESTVIGGEGIEVEIDETKLGKRKYHRGHRVEGIWVVGGVERTLERKIFIVPVENRNSETLQAIINTHVNPGSTIITDLWKGYNSISEYNEYEHLTVNHSKNFKDPVTGAHSNTIEGTWNGLKMRIKPRSRTKNNIENRLWEFIWRRQNKDKLWDAFIDALKTVYYE